MKGAGPAAAARSVIHELVVARRSDVAVLRHGTPLKEMLIEDAARALEIDGGIPRVLGVDDHHGPVPALVHAPGVVDADEAFEPALGGALLQECVNFLGP